MAEKKPAAKKPAAKTPTVVFARTTTAIGFAGGVVQLSTNEVWDATDPLVKEHPELFDKTPQRMRTTTDPKHRERPVERAVQAPGQKR